MSIDEKINCPHCGTPMRASWGFCHHCGTCLHPADELTASDGGYVCSLCGLWLPNKPDEIVIPE
jgi:DNA-directed RNA polymerase subunit RPC12/RpoP